MNDKKTRTSVFISEQADIINILSYVYENDKDLYDIIRNEIMFNYITMVKEN